MENINEESQRNCCNKVITNTPTYTENICQKLNIGDNAPEFTANTTFGECKLSDYRGKWLVFFCHPGDHTPVCTTEFISFSNYHSKFKKINCELLALSVDNITSHLSWVYDIYKSTGIQIPFPIIDDKKCKIAKMYNMMGRDDEATIRSVYIICPEGKIRAILEYPASLGRNIGEILRMVEALQESDVNKVATPAGWVPGMPTISLAPKTQSEMLEKVCNTTNYNCVDWFLCFNNKPQNNCNNC